MAAAAKLAIVLSIALVLYVNGFALFLWLTGIDRQYVYVLLSIVLLIAVAWWGLRSIKTSPAELGLSKENWAHSAIIGLIAGLVLAVPALVFLVFPIALATAPNYSEIDNLTWSGFLWRVGVEAAIATALTEEFVFRGVLQSLFMRSYSANRAALWTTFVFVLWHLVTNARTLQQNAISLPLVPQSLAQIIGYLGSLTVVAVAGMVFSGIRIRTRSLAGSITAHWVSVAAITVFLFGRHQLA